MGLTYDRNKTFAVDPRLNAVKLKRRTRGWPKNIGRALAKEPEDGEHAQPRDEDEAGGERPEETGGANRTKGTREASGLHIQPLLETLRSMMLERCSQAQVAGVGSTSMRMWRSLIWFLKRDWLQPTFASFYNFMPQLSFDLPREKNISNKTNPDEVVAPTLLLTAYSVLKF